MELTPEIIDAVLKLRGVWSGINGRCNHPSQRGYAQYGAVGLGLDPEWSHHKGMIRFMKWAVLNGWRPGLVIDRTDNTKGYGPNNCRCVTQKVNMRNQKRNRLLTYQGETKCAAEWGDDPRCAVHTAQFQQRIASGWDVERALTTKLNPLHVQVSRSIKWRTRQAKK